jgi:hypothetical protein
MRWRLILEEYGPEIIYVKGSTNIAADALSRLNLQITVKENDTTENNDVTHRVQRSDLHYSNFYSPAMTIR